MMRWLLWIMFFVSTAVLAQSDVCDEVVLTRPQYKCIKNNEQVAIKSKVIVTMATDEPAKEEVKEVKEPVKEEVKEVKEPVKEEKTVKPECPVCPKEVKKAPVKKAKKVPVKKAKKVPEKECPKPKQVVTSEIKHYSFYYTNDKRANRSYDPYMFSVLIGGLWKDKYVVDADEYVLPTLGAEFTYFPTEKVGIGFGAYTDRFVFGKVSFKFGS